MAEQKKEVKKDEKIVIDEGDLQNLSFITTSAIIHNAEHRQTVIDIINAEKEIATKSLKIQAERDELLKERNKLLKNVK